MYRVGEWVYSEFKLKQIREIKSNRVTSVTDGYFTSSYINYNDEIFPVDMETKLISDAYQAAYKKIQDINFNSFNHPDFNRFYIEHWIGTCNKRYDRNFIENRVDDINQITNEIIKEIDDFYKRRIQGIRLIR